MTIGLLLEHTDKLTLSVLEKDALLEEMAEALKDNKKYMSSQMDYEGMRLTNNLIEVLAKYEEMKGGVVGISDCL